jgi:hypothetical protein
MKKTISKAFLLTLLLAGTASAQIVTGGSSSGSGNGVGAGASPVMGLYLANSCSVANTGSCYFTLANTQQDVTCSWATTGPTITCSDGPFVSTDVGKRAFGWYSCVPFTNQILSTSTNGAITNSAAVTIATFVSATQVTLSANPANAASVVAGFGGCFVWGAPDDTGMASLSTAVAAALQCPKVFMASAYYMLTTIPGFAINQPLACQHGPTVYNPVNGTNSDFGNIFNAAGFEIEGRGPANTIWWLTPGFPESGPGCVNGYEGFSCFVRVVEGKWKDFEITGGFSTNGAATKTLLRVEGPGSLDNMVLMNWGPGSPNSTTDCVLVTGWDFDFELQLSGCGVDGLIVGGAASNGVNVTCIRCAIEGSPNANLEVFGPPLAQNNYNITYKDGILGRPAAWANGSQNNASIFSIDGAILLDHVSVYNSDATTAGIGGYQCGSTAGCVLTARDSTITWSLGASGTYALKCSVACTTQLSNVQLSASGTGNSYVDVTGSNLYDLGGPNTGYTSGAGLSVAGTLHHNETGTCTFAASTTCTVTFAETFGTQGKPTFLIPPNIPGTATTLTVSALSVTGATITASASNSSPVSWQAVQQ